MKTPRKPFLAALALAVAAFAGDAVAGKSDQYGRAIIAYEETFDGGTRTRAASMPVKVDNTTAAPMATLENGYESSTLNCIEVTCATTGSPDAGLDRLNATVGTRYVSTVSSNSDVRVNDRAACASFAGGAGRVLPAGSTLDWLQGANGLDGGTASYRCCAETAGTVWQLCPKQ